MNPKYNKSASVKPSKAISQLKQSFTGHQTLHCNTGCRASEKVRNLSGHSASKTTLALPNTDVKVNMSSHLAELTVIAASATSKPPKHCAPIVLTGVRNISVAPLTTMSASSSRKHATITSQDLVNNKTLSNRVKYSSIIHRNNSSHYGAKPQQKSEKEKLISNNKAKELS